MLIAKEVSGQDIKGQVTIPVVTEEVRKKRKYAKRAKVPAVSTRAPGALDVCEDDDQTWRVQSRRELFSDE